MTEKPATPEEARRWSDEALDSAIECEELSLSPGEQTELLSHHALWYYDLAEAYDASARSRGT